MRQVTGRSSNNSESKASIRLASGGRFFSASTLAGIAEGADVDVIIDTARVTLVPQQMAESVSAERLLAITGQSPLTDEVAIFSDAVNEKVAVVAVNKDVYETLMSRLGSKMHIYSPLQSDNYSHGRGLVIEVSENICYLRLYNNGLQLAEAVDVESYDELLYYVANILNLAKESNDIPMYIMGSNKAYKLLKKYYTVICE